MPLWLGICVVSKSFINRYSAAGTAFLQICFSFWITPLGYFYCDFAKLFSTKKGNRHTVQVEICKCALFSISLTTLGLTVVIYFAGMSHSLCCKAAKSAINCYYFLPFQSEPSLSFEHYLRDLLGLTL